MTGGWLGVVSAAHVRRGADLSIAQFNHGNRARLERMRAGDTLISSSPTERRGDHTPDQCFTASGIFPDRHVWQARQGHFTPFRRRIDHLPAQSASLADPRHRLQLTPEPSWGNQLRYGLVPLEPSDVQIITEAMQT